MDKLELANFERGFRSSRLVDFKIPIRSSLSPKRLTRYISRQADAVGQSDKRPSVRESFSDHVEDYAAEN